MNVIEQFLGQMGEETSGIARETATHFGEATALQVVHSASDGMVINHAILDSYSQAHLANMVFAQS